MQDTLAHKHVSTQDTLASEHVRHTIQQTLIIYNNSNSFYFLWLWTIIAITFIENILIYWYFWYYLKSPETFTLITVSTLFSSFILHLHFYIYISFYHIGQSHSVLHILIRPCDALPSPTKFLPCIIIPYCRCRLFKSKKWCRPWKDNYHWQEPNPRCSKLFAFK